MQREARIYVAGHRGLVGSAIVRRLRAAGFERLLLKTHAELDLTDERATRAFFDAERPQFVFLAAAKVGGIVANNTYPAEFIRDNLAIQTNVIHAAHLAGVERLLFLGSSCIYPKLAPQPLVESSLLTGPLEPTNRPYALAKIAGIEMCWSYNRQYGTRYLAAMPTNLYGPGDNYHPQNSHVIPALLRKFHEAKASGAPSVTVWGTGTPRREFLYVDDMADACLHLMERYDGEDIINVGPGDDIAIGDLARLIRDVVGYEGALTQDLSKPDGHPRKLMDVSRLFATGWRPKVGLEEGLRRTYRWFLENAAPPVPQSATATGEAAE